MRLIDADALIEQAEEDMFDYEAEQFAARVSWCPTVDAVEVVRCKDCKHWHKETGWCAEHSSFINERGVFCHPWESANWKMFDDNDFCSYGERKENE